MLASTLPSALERGSLDLCQLKRFWAAIQLNDSDALSTDYHKNRLLFDALGAGFHQGLNFLYAHQPTFEEFEHWITSVVGQPSNDTIQRFNNYFLDLPPPAIIQEKLKKIDHYPNALNAEQLNSWHRNGYTVVKNAVDLNACKAAEQAIWQYIKAAPEKPESWYGKNDSQIMIELIQHPALQNNRDNIRIHKAFSQLWGTSNLWCSADRCSFHPPQKPGYPFPGPDLHWDMDLRQPETFSTQGILYLTNTPEEQGALTLVPGFHHKLKDWLADLEDNQDPQQQNLHALGSKAIAANAGDLIIWHHALPHGSRPNLTQQPRIAQYINFYPFNFKS